MARYQVLYWKHVPRIVRAEDDLGEIQISMGVRFAQILDFLATRDQCEGSESYLEGWYWSAEQERPGSAAAVAADVKSELELRRILV